MVVPISRCQAGLPFSGVVSFVIMMLSGCGAGEGQISTVPSPEPASTLLPVDPPQESLPQPAPVPEPATSVAPPVPTSTVTAGNPIPSPVPNQIPKIGGKPGTAIEAGRTYLFVPSVSDGDHDPLRFSIVNKPVWSVFDALTGKLTGSPKANHVGTTTSIVISVSDGKAKASLVPFSIMVNPATASTATLTWVAPSEYEDGRPLKSFDGYRIYYWKDQNAERVVDIPNASVSTFIFDNLAPALWHFRMTAVLDGVEGSSTLTGSKTIS